jgi:hypothetical protein
LPRGVAYEKTANLVEAARRVEVAIDAGEIDLNAPLADG